MGNGASGIKRSSHKRTPKQEKAYTEWLKKQAKKLKPKAITDEVTFYISGALKENNDTFNTQRPTRIQFRKTKEGKEEVVISICDDLVVGSGHGRDYQQMLTLDSERITRIGYNKNEKLGLGFDIEYKGKDEHGETKRYLWKAKYSKDEEAIGKERKEFELIKAELFGNTEDGERFPKLAKKVKRKVYFATKKCSDNPESTSDNGGKTDEEKTPEPEPVNEPVAPKKKFHGLPVLSEYPEDFQESHKLRYKMFKGTLKEVGAKVGHGKNMVELQSDPEFLKRKAANETRRLAANDSLDNVFSMLWILPLLVIFVFWFKRYIVTIKNNDNNDIVQDNVTEGENDLSNIV